MKKKFLLLLTLLCAGVVIFISCKRVQPCEGCINGNRPPIAVAGPDQVLTLPTDSVLLDGSASSDPDGTISEWLWAKISGPASFNIVNTSVAKSIIKNLATGTYQFELTVKDNGGLSAKDTITITVDATRTTNHPPNANAGTDQTITLPTNSVNLDGSASSDPDNSITNYAWTKISGPSSFSIANASTVQTQVTNLIQGVYQFEIKVTDTEGLFAKDTMQVIVNAQPPPIPTCAPLSRPIINVQLIPLGNIPNPGDGSAIVWADNKIFFAGGGSGSSMSSGVDIFNLTTHTWSTTNLSLPRTNISAVACANKVFFAGGISSSGPSSRVDIYDIATQTWSTAELSEARIRIATATTGNKVFFAGGCSNTPYEWSGVSNKIDIYDLTTNTWSIKILGETKIGFTATTAGNKVYFAGGWNLNPNVGNSTSANIDIYDDIAGIWSTSTLNVAKGFHAGIFKNGKIYWAGGLPYIDEPWVGGNVTTCQVEIKDLNSQSSTFSNLSTTQEWFNWWSDAFEKDDKIAFTNYDYQSSSWYLDIYNTTTNTWSIGVSSQGAGFYRIISANSNVYLIGGVHVWKLEF